MIICLTITCASIGGCITKLIRIFCSQLEKTPWITKVGKFDQHQRTQTSTKCQNLMDLHVFSRKTCMLNIVLSLSRCVLRFPRVIRLWGISMRCVMLNSFWGCLVSYHCLNVCICWSKLHKVEMLLCVILWRPSS